MTSLERSKILGHEDPDVGEGREGGEQDGDDEGFSLLSGRAGKDVGRRRVSILRDGGSGSAGEEDVDDVLGLRRGVFGDRRSSLTLKQKTKRRAGSSARETKRVKRKRARTNLGCLTFREVDDNSPSEIEIVVLDGDETTGLEEREGVGWVGDDVSEILTEFLELFLPVVVLSDGFLVGDNDLRAFDLGETEF